MALSALEIISQDLDWREAELGSLKLLLARGDTSGHQKVVLLRACWALLYAHYEGFVKNSLTIFFDHARVSINNCGSLPVLTRLFALDAKLREMRSLPGPDLLDQIENFMLINHAVRPTFPDVDTKSNLWPNVLQELLDAADIQLSALSTHHLKIKTLVAKRNKIAHGNRELINDLLYYKGFEDAVYDLMYDLAYSIDDRLRKAPYV